MKKLSLAFAATLSLALFGLPGCSDGGGENTVIQSSGDPGITAEQQQQIEAEMQAGGGYSSQPGN